MDDRAIVYAAIEVVRSLDGTMGKTWSEVADRVASKDYYHEIAPGPLAALIRALIAAGELRD